MKESETQEAIEAGDQRKSVYKARFCDKYIKGKWWRQQVYEKLDFSASSPFTLSMQSRAKQYFQWYYLDKVSREHPPHPTQNPRPPIVINLTKCLQVFFPCLIWGSQVCKCLLLWHFLILWEFHSLIHHPIWFDQKKLERFIQNKVYWDFFFVSKCMEDYVWCVWHVYKIHVLL